MAHRRLGDMQGALILRTFFAGWQDVQGKGILKLTQQVGGDRVTHLKKSPSEGLTGAYIVSILYPQGR